MDALERMSTEYLNHMVNRMETWLSKEGRTKQSYQIAKSQLGAYQYELSRRADQ